MSAGPHHPDRSRALKPGTRPANIGIKPGRWLVLGGVGLRLVSVGARVWRLMRNVLGSVLAAQPRLSFRSPTSRT